MPDGMFLPGLRQRRIKPPGGLTLRRDHPLARGLVAYVVFGGPYGLGYDVVTGSLFAPSNSPSLRAARDGIGLDLTGTAFVSAASRPAWNVTGDVTVAWRGLLRSVVSNNSLICKIPTGGGGGANTPFSLEVTNPDAGKVSFVRSNTGGLNFRVWQSGSVLVAVNTLTTLGVSAGPSMDAAPVFYAGGALDTGAPTSQFGGAGTGAATTNGDPLVIGRRPDGGGQMDGVASVMAVANRRWIAAEHALFDRDPYGLVEAVEERLFFAYRTPPLTSTITAGTLSLTASLAAEWAADPTPDTGARGGDDAWREDVVRLSRRERRLRRQDEERAGRLREALERAHRAATVGDEPALAVAVEQAAEAAQPAQRGAIAAIPAADGMAQTLVVIESVLRDIQQRRSVVSRDDDDLAVLLSVF